MIECSAKESENVQAAARLLAGCACDCVTTLMSRALGVMSKTPEVLCRNMSQKTQHSVT
jgi:hypothetical protein